MALPSMSWPLKLALAPLLAVQAVSTRRRAPVLPEAAGPRRGQAGRGPARWRLLVLGDSSAAGVGVARQESALAGPVARRLQRHTGMPVAWALHARSGLSTPALRAWLHASPPGPADIALVVTGVNDVLEQVSPAQAVREREALVERLATAHGVRHTAFAALPPLHRFPLLPQPLRHVLGADARRHDRALAQWAGRRAGTHGDVSHVPIAFDLGIESMAADGFHPGAPVYAACVAALADHLAGQVLPGLSPQETTT